MTNGNDLSNLFGDDTPEAEDAFSGLFDDAPSTEETVDAFSGLFDDEPTDGGLGDLFGEDEVSAVEESSDESFLGDLFAQDEEVVTVTPVEVTKVVETAAVTTETKVEKPAEEAAPVRRKRPAPTLGEPVRPTRKIELKGKPVTARKARVSEEETLVAKSAGSAGELVQSVADPVADAAKEVVKELAPEITKAEPEVVFEAVKAVETTKVEVTTETPAAPVEPEKVEILEPATQEVAAEDFAESAAEAEVEMKAAAVEALPATEVAEGEKIAEVATSAEKVQEMEEAASPAEEPVLAVTEEEETFAFEAPLEKIVERRNIVADRATPAPKAAPVTEPEPEVSAPTASRVDKTSLKRHLKDQGREAMDQRVSEGQAVMQRYSYLYENADMLWDKVDRIFGVMGNEPRLQDLNNELVLTRDHILDNEQRQKLYHELDSLIAANPHLAAYSQEEANLVYQMIYDEVIGISVLGPLWRDDNVSEILVDGWDTISVEYKGVLIRTPLRFRDKKTAERVARDFAVGVSDRSVSKSNPLVTAELPRARIQFAYGAIARSELVIAIRKFQPLLTLEKLLEYNSLNEDMLEFLQAAVEAKANILVSGGTGTGKTTIINLLSRFIPTDERVITIEDSFELSLENLHWTPLQTKEKASADDEVSVSQADLLRGTLRLRPDRIIVGEIRDSNGAEVMTEAANTGHEGTMTTIHANSGSKAVNTRLAGLLRRGSNQGTSEEVAREIISSAFQVVVQVSRKRDRRFISEISVIDPEYVKNGVIVPQTIFKGRVGQDGQTEFMRDKNLEPGTDLYEKFEDANLDTTIWES